MAAREWLLLFCLGCCAGALVACGSVSPTGDGDDAGSDDGGGDGDGDGDSELPARSGTRIKAQYYRHAESGATIYRRAWDSLLEAPCNYATASDGKLRCLPRSYLDTVFLDAECTQAAYMAPDSDLSEFTYSRTKDYACGETSHFTIYRVDRDVPIDASAGVYRNLTGGMCGATEVPDTDTVYQVRALAATDLVEGSVEATDYAQNLQWRRIRGSDGSLVPGTLWDTARDQNCAIESLSLRCGPGPKRIGFENRTFFVDDACSVRGVGRDGGDRECPPQTMRRSENTGTCSYEVNYFEAGAQVDTVYREDQLSCTPVAEPPDVYSIGAQIDVSTLPLVQVQTFERAAGQVLAQRRYVDQLGAPISDIGFWHLGWQDKCQLAEIDGQTRCAPTKGPRVHSNPQHGPPAYDNAACSGERLAELNRCQALNPGEMIHDPTTYQRFAVGAEYTGDLWFLLPSGSCEIVGWESRWFRVGAELTEPLPLLEEVEL